MKTPSIGFSAILMAVAVLVFAQSASGAQGMKMPQNMPGMSHAAKAAQGVGVIEAIDKAKGTITIKHQPIASLNWPAMTMSFKVDPPSLLQSVKVGEKVNFTLHSAGANNTVTAITAVSISGSEGKRQ